MKQYLKPLLILLPIILVISYYLYRLSHRSEFPEEPGAQVQQKKAFETLVIEKLTDWKGTEHSIANAAEPIVIMHFWASWCGPCVTEFPDLINLAKSTKGKIQVFAISEDKDRSEIQAFIKSFKEAETTPNFHIIWDEDHSVMNSWEVDKLPESYIFGPSRQLAKHVSGAVPWTSNDSKEYFDFLISQKK